MNFLDMKTIYFSTFATDAVCTMVLVLLWRQSRERFAGTHLWALDSALHTAGLLLVVLRGTVPDWMSFVLANTMILSGTILGLMGLERFLGKKGPQLQNVVLLGVFTFIQSYFTFIQPDLRIRSINICIGLIAICSQCMWLMLVRIESQRLPLTRNVGFVFAAFCLVSLVRAYDMLTAHRVHQDYFQSDLLERLIPLAYQLLLILLTYSLSLMVNKRLLLKVKSEEEKFSTAFHFSPYAIILTRLGSGSISLVNESFLKVTGYSHAEVLGKTICELQLWENDNDLNSPASQLSSEGTVHQMEGQFRTKSGGLRTGLFSSELITINDEKCLLSNFVDITDRKQSEHEREKLIAELQKAFAEIRTLSGLLPICASCKKIRDDKGYWKQLELYIEEHSEAEFTHSICPACAHRLYPEIADRLDRRTKES